MRPLLPFLLMVSLETQSLVAHTIRRQWYDDSKMKWKRCGIKVWWPHLGQYPGICLKGLRAATENLRIVSVATWIRGCTSRMQVRSITGWANLLGVICLSHDKKLSPSSSSQIIRPQIQAHFLQLSLPKRTVNLLVGYAGFRGMQLPIRRGIGLLVTQP